jgi:hypothetical protein
MLGAAGNAARERTAGADAWFLTVCFGREVTRALLRRSAVKSPFFIERGRCREEVFSRGPPVALPRKTIVSSVAIGRPRVFFL